MKKSSCGTKMGAKTVKQPPKVYTTMKKTGKKK